MLLLVSLPETSKKNPETQGFKDEFPIGAKRLCSGDTLAFLEATWRIIPGIVSGLVGDSQIFKPFI